MVLVFRVMPGWGVPAQDRGSMAFLEGLAKWEVLQDLELLGKAGLPLHSHSWLEPQMAEEGGHFTQELRILQNFTFCQPP